MDITLDYYNKNADAFINNTIDANVENLYKIFQKYVKPGATILDLGCGSGRDSHYFIEQGYNLVAVDGSPQLCQKASAYIKQEVICETFNQLSFSNQFDGIWACSSILHVSLKELPAIFKKIEQALKEEGYLYASFKYGQSSGERNGRIFTNFTEESFKTFFKQIEGFEIIEIQVTEDVRKDRSNEKWLNVVLQKT